MDSTFKNLTIHGGLEFKNLKVENQLIVHGGMEGKKLQVGSLKTHGGMDGQNIVVKEKALLHGTSKLRYADFQGEFTAHGKLTATESRFKNIMTGSKKVILKDSEIDGSVIFEVTHNNEPQELYLKGETVVRGNIEFISGKGRVFIAKDAKVIGKIKGAK